MNQLQQLKDRLNHFVEQVQNSDINQAQKAQIIKTLCGYSGVAEG